MERKADIFISYSRKDSDFVRKLRTALQKEGREAWIDWVNIPASAKWKDEILRGIEHADSFIFVISPDALSSAICVEEVVHAARHNKRLIPILWRHTNESGNVLLCTLAKLVILAKSLALVGKTLFGVMAPSFAPVMK